MTTSFYLLRFQCSGSCNFVLAFSGLVERSPTICEMSVPSLYVSADVSKRALALINAGHGDKVKEGVELLLNNDSTELAPGRLDAGSLLQRGLGMLASSPYEALGIPVGCGTIDVRKAYKKMALKYHPGRHEFPTHHQHI